MLLMRGIRRCSRLVEYGAVKGCFIAFTGFLNAYFSRSRMSAIGRQASVRFLYVEEDIFSDSFSKHNPIIEL